MTGCVGGLACSLQVVQSEYGSNYYRYDSMDNR